MFEFLFNYPRSTWLNAELVFASGWSTTILFALLALAVVCIIVSLLRQPLGAGRRIVTGLMQALLVACALWMLWQPNLRQQIMQPGENTVAYLVDTSGSMQQRDVDSASRLQAATSLLDADALTSSDVFDAAIYSLAENLEELDSVEQLPSGVSTGLSNVPIGNRSDIAGGLLDVIENANDKSLAAVVLLTDGADNGTALGAEWWQRLRAAGVPVHTIGFGNRELVDDIELVSVEMDAVASEDAPVRAVLRIAHAGTDAVRLRVQSGSELLLAEDIELDQTQQETIHEVTFAAGSEGVRNIRFSLQSDMDEANRLNNSQQRLLEVADAPKRILYVEGEPRWEYKFIRRAVASYASIEVVSLLKTSPNKFYRQGVRDASELAGGFPKTREALYAYDAIIIGSLEAAELNAAQQGNLRDFVSQRGGSLLLLAGRHGLADGGWGRSAVGSALPVNLGASASSNTYQRQRISIEPTTQGWRTRWLQFDEDDVINRDSWAALPALADIQGIGDIKAGASVLLQTITAGNNTRPVLAWQRYGQGQSFVFGTSGTWRWQMRMPSENQQHELFWQQLLTHLVSGALQQIAIDTGSPLLRDSDTVPVSVMARQSDFKPLESGELVASVEGPGGQQQSVVLQADINQPGRYTGDVPAGPDGPYAISVSLPLSGEAQAAGTPAQALGRVIAESGTAESFATRQNAALLERVAAVTGGRYMENASAAELATLLGQSNAGVTREQLMPLWNMPVLFLLLALGKALEWLLRLKWKRL